MPCNCCGEIGLCLIACLTAVTMSTLVFWILTLCEFEVGRCQLNWTEPNRMNLIASVAYYSHQLQWMKSKYLVPLYGFCSYSVQYLSRILLLHHNFAKFSFYKLYLFSPYSLSVYLYVCIFLFLSNVKLILSIVVDIIKTEIRYRLVPTFRRNISDSFTLVWNSMAISWCVVLFVAAYVDWVRLSLNCCH
jgi:hypothetical protein